MFFLSPTSGRILYILIFIVAYIMALFVAMPFHEFAHAWVAKTQGDYTAVAYKRCTLAALSHIDIKGFLFLLLFGFGWAKPVPIDERNFKHGKRSKFLVSIAGILTNLILGTIFIFLYVLLNKYAYSFLNSNLYGVLLNQFLSISISLNFILAFFNLLPIYPLDGFRIIETFTKPDNKFLKFMASYSFFIYIILLLFGVFELYYTYTAGYLVEGLFKLFYLILGV